MLHRILEKINFSEFKCLQHVQDAIPYIRPFIYKTAFKDWEYALASILFHTLKTPLHNSDDSFCLADIERQELYRETPFLFPHKGEIPIEGINISKGFVQGVIDLIFIHQGKYYIIDWKSNWLGPNSEAYHPVKLQAAMSEHYYFLQAALYKEALQRYLKLVEKRPFDQCFGGLFYLFLRGMQIGSQAGIYYFDPALEPVIQV